ncbi:winged helix-turn-helix domain-containing protein [Actinoalloteichus spitiensis]|uniref:winged helix-turn-helix domain-containing protein n=1 Tax=Actinoalloteichus spitiensis TaxID=252394 RepID=UPI00037DEF50|nr:transcriptional regulator [Actinoalloteichus spitiensis]
MSARTADYRRRLDELIHTPVRLSVMALLARDDRVAFGHLRDAVDVSDSLLSKHMATLERAGYVTVTKGHEGRRPRTWYSLTDRGRRAFLGYRQALRHLLDAE